MRFDKQGGSSRGLTSALRCALATLLLYPALVQSQSATSPLWHRLTPGPYSVGFELTTIAETSTGRTRSVRVATWYPARPPAVPAMRFGAYASATPSVIVDPSADEWQAKRDRESLDRQFFGPRAAEHKAQLFDAPTATFPSARPVGGRFPIVLHSLGRNGGLYQHTILWEYLASHGYIVTSVGQFGRDVQAPGMEFSQDGLAYQLRDMRAALSAIARRSNADSTRVALLGHSSGAIVSLWLAAENPAVSAVVGLDGSNNRDEGGKDIFFRGIGKQVINAAFLNICRWPHDEFTEYASRVLRGPYARIGYAKGMHIDFQNWPAYMAFAGATDPSSEKVRSTAEALAQFEATAQFTLEFLRARLGNDSSAARNLASADWVSRVAGGTATLWTRAAGR